jgi:hypothetical protein
MVMTKPKRELLKFRPGDCGLKIRKDGQLEVAGVSEDSPMIDNKGMVNPVMLFAAAWARKDQKCFEALLTNFKDSVKEGFFGQDAKQDFEKALKLQEEVTAKKPLPPFSNPEKLEAPVLDPDSKPNVSSSLGNEFETHSDKPNVTAPSASVVGSSNIGDVASGAVTFEQPAPLTDGGCGNADSDSGAVTFEQPKPYDKDGMLKGRDS